MSASSKLAAAAAGGKDSGAPAITHAQRAAVIIAMLGEGAARPIVEKLDDAALAQIAEALESVSLLAREELAEIVIDFLQHLRRTSGSFRGGRDKAREIISGLLDESRFSQIFGEGPVAAASAPSDRLGTWGRLERHDPEKVAAYFDGLTPNIIALILRKLDVSVSSEIVSHLNEAKLDAVIGQLVEAEAPDPQIDAVIARMVEIEFLNNQDEAGGEEDDSHLESIGELLSLIPSDKRERLVAFLNESHETKMKSIEKVLFTIEGLPEMLPRQSVPVVFRELGEDTMNKVLVSLKGGAESVSEYLLGNISSRLADQYRTDVADASPLSPEAAETEQRQFLTALMSLKRRGLIVMEKAAQPEQAKAS